MEKVSNSENFKKNVSIILITRNEEQIIENTIKNLLDQDLVPKRIIAVNDGSTDRTQEIISKFSTIELVNLEERKGGESWLGKKELAKTINSGLNLLTEEKNCGFIMITGSDLLFPRNYLSTISSRMYENPKIVISSGVIRGEFSIEPRGAGRIVQYDFWKKLGLKYPINYGYEAYLLLKAKSLGYETISYSDLIIETQRKTGSSYDPKLFYYYGLGLKALGYTFPYVIGRALLFAKKKPIGAFHLVRGFLSKYCELYEQELRNYVKKTQYRKISTFDKEYYKRIKGKLGE